MTLEKLRLRPLPPSKLPEVPVLFNPNAYSVAKSVTWSTAPGTWETGAQTERKKNAPALTFGGGGSRRLTLELLFDVTEPVAGKQIADVRTRTNQIVQLSRIERDLGRPPACEISWGRAPTGSDFPFIGVISELAQRFTLFRADGTPVRAMLTVSFTEFLDPERDLRETDPEFTTRVVKMGDSLSRIAAEVYHDATRWRVIAEANDLDDVRRLTPGLRLDIPKLG